MDTTALKRNQTNGLLVDTDLTDGDKFVVSPKGLASSRSVAAIGGTNYGRYIKSRPSVMHGGADIMGNTENYQN